MKKTLFLIMLICLWGTVCSVSAENPWYIFQGGEQNLKCRIDDEGTLHLAKVDPAAEARMVTSEHALDPFFETQDTPRTEVTKFVVDGDDTIHIDENGAQLMFYGFHGLREVDLSKFDFTNASSLYFMFGDCFSLKTVDLSGMDTKNVTNFNAMFTGCKSLEKLDLSGFDTSKAEDFGSTFYDCSALTELDLSSWNTSKAEKMSEMFRGCESLKNLVFGPDWDTPGVTNMWGMFYECKSLTMPDISGWNTGNVTSMTNMFLNCEAITSLNLSGWDTSKVTEMNSMFSGCSALKILDLNNWDTSNVTDMDYIFFGIPLEQLVPGKNFSFSTNDAGLWEGTWTFIEPAPDNNDPIAIGTTYTTEELIKNYSSRAAGTWVHSAEKKDVTVLITGIDWQLLYNGSLQTAAVQYQVDCDDDSFTDEEKALISYNGNLTVSGENAGNYPYGLSGDLFVYGGSKFNVTFSVSDGSLTIDPKPLTHGSIQFSLDPMEYTYDGAAHDLNDIVSIKLYDDERKEFLVPGVDYEIDPEKSDMAAQNVGFYTVTVTADNKLTGNDGSQNTYKTITGMNYTGYTSMQWQIIPGQEPPQEPIRFFSLVGRDCILPNTGLTSVTGSLKKDAPAVLKSSTLNMRLMIPTLSVDSELIPLSRRDNTWDVEELGDRVGVLEGSAMPGKGYTVAAGHNTLGSEDYGPFASLSSMKNGDLIFVRYDSGASLRFIVYANELLKPNDFRTMESIASGEPETLMLVTCENESVTGQYLNRRVVFAKPAR